MLLVRLKQFECAMADGRLDEACELARPASLRADRRGQELVGALARALVERGGLHADAGRVAEADADCRKAAELAGNTPEIAQLRAIVADLQNKSAQALAQRQHSQRLAAQAVESARRYAEIGQFSVGQAALAAAGADPRALAMNQDLAARRASASAALAKAKECFEAGDWEAALRQLALLRDRRAASAELSDLSARIGLQVTGRVKIAIEAGRLDQASELLGRLDELGAASLETRELRRTLGQFRAAFEAVQTAEPHRAIEALKLLEPLWPNAHWISTAVEQLTKLGMILQGLRTGPLARVTLTHMTADSDETLPPLHARAAGAIAHTPVTAPARATETPARNFLLQVDGVGSFVVSQKAVVTIGPANGESAADVALLADAATPRIVISRADGDYFLRSAAAINVNDRPTTGTLLSDGDKIALSPRCRLTFRRPNAASGTAALDLSGARLARGDIRRIILLDREILIGPGASAHVRCDELTGVAVLQATGDAGTFSLRSADAVQVDGKAADKPGIICLGQHVRVGVMTFVITDSKS